MAFTYPCNVLVTCVEYVVMRLHRFYVNKPLGEEIVVENVGDTEVEKKLLHQWTNVFRYTSGDEVFLFSSVTPGKDFLYKILSISKQAATLTLVTSSANSVPTFPFTLVMALVKKDTFETIARQATELGVTRIIPVVAARSEKKNLNFERLSTIVIEACEQSGRGSIPLLSEIVSFESACISNTDTVSLIGSLSGDSLTNIAKKGLFKDLSERKGLTLWIGPEGGWTAEEESLAQNAGILPFLHTKTVLKADTAAIALISALLALPEANTLA